MGPGSLAHREGYMTAFARKICLLSTVAPLFAVGLVSPAIAQSGAPASGTSSETPTAVAPAPSQPGGHESTGLTDIIGAPPPHQAGGQETNGLAGLHGPPPPHQ